MSDVPTMWIPPERAREVLGERKRDFPMLYDLTGIDERSRRPKPAHDFTVVYHLMSLDRDEDVRVKVALAESDPRIPSISDLWPCANWYEREAWDMFGIVFEGHPNLRRILMPNTWIGHPLRKDHHARATEMGPFRMTDDLWEAEEEAHRFRPEDWGLRRRDDGTEFLFLNVGPHHPGTHGVFRVVLQLDGEEILDAVPEIGFHHRGAEKMAERQTWHTFIPYTDRIDYLGGVMNNLPYVMAVEKLAGIEVPDRAQVIRVMLCELFRIQSHLVWYGTFAQDLGAMSPVFYAFNDRERIFEVVEAITGGRMHPAWFRIGGVAQDLPDGWDRMVRDLLDYLPDRIDEYDDVILRNPIFEARTRGVGSITTRQAIEWGVTGPNLRATGLRWDYRKRRPYSGYERFDFEIPTAEGGDCYARSVVRVEEMRQSLRIVEQCLNHMPEGDYQARHPLATPPIKDRTMRDIETLIAHFLSVSWGSVIPAGECHAAVEGTKGINGYYLVSDGGPSPYRARIRTPSFPHLQTVPLMTRGRMIPDLMAVLGSIDFVLADVDR